MRLPAQAAAVVRGAFSWPKVGLGSPVAAVGPAGGTNITCKDPTPNLCVCTNGVATCCSDSFDGCTADTNGTCSCSVTKTP